VSAAVSGTAVGAALRSGERVWGGRPRPRGRDGFSLNDALIELELPAGAGSAQVRGEIDRLLGEHLLDVGNDERGRVVYREP
jgi:hypothetical protein